MLFRASMLSPQESLRGLQENIDPVVTSGNHVFVLLAVFVVCSVVLCLVLCVCFNRSTAHELETILSQSAAASAIRGQSQQDHGQTSANSLSDESHSNNSRMRRNNGSQSARGLPIALMRRQESLPPSTNNPSLRNLVFRRNNNTTRTSKRSSATSNTTAAARSLPQFKSRGDPKESIFDRESIRMQYLNFMRQSVQSEGGLSSILQNRFSVRPAMPAGNGSRFSNFSAANIRADRKRVSSDNDLNTYKNGISEDERMRFLNMKKESIRLSDNLSRLGKLMGFDAFNRDSFVAPPAPSWHATAKGIVKKLCDTLEAQILTAEEVDTLEKVLHSKETILLGFIDRPKDGRARIDLEDYLFSLVTGLNRWFSSDPEFEAVGIRSLLIGLIYINKIKKSEIGFTLTVYNVHRLFAITMLVAAKFSEDECISNRYWSDITGLDMDELNLLEEDFCFKAGFDFFFSREELEEMYDNYGLVVKRDEKNSVFLQSFVSDFSV